MRVVLVSLFSLFSLACGATPSIPPSTPIPSSSTEPDPSRLSHPLDVADGVGTFTSIPWGFETSSYWIEGPSGVVVIDTQFLPSEAERLLAHVERATPKPIVLALVLHPNPDKFNGTDVFRARGIPVMTSAQVLAAVPDVAARRRRAFLARYAPDYPERDPELASFGDATRTLEVAGLTLKLHVLGPGCSAAHVAVEWNGHLFAGDLIASRTHPWLELGFVRDWTARLDELDALAPRRVHPGRGPSGGRELLASTRAYLTRVLELVAASAAETPRDPAIRAIRDRLVAEHPDYAYPVFLFGLAAVWDAEHAR
jgi:glyoxylase-like metal-dependent hydrolase (beta-lactamase superfamily II)